MKANLKQRFAILGGAIVNLFTGRGVWLQGSISIQLGTPGMTMEAYVQRTEGKWEHVAAHFDFDNPPIGYKDGVAVGITTSEESK